jgi:hypothetical protein
MWVRIPPWVLMEQSRKFSNSRYNSFNDKALQKAIALFTKLGYSVEQPENKFIVDLVVRKGDSSFAVEVEVKSAWVGLSFPFDDIQFLPRKYEKWFDEKYNLGHRTHWLLFNKDLSHHLMVRDNEIKSAMENNQFRQVYLDRHDCSENFLCIPFKDCKIDPLGAL